MALIGNPHPLGATSRSSSVNLLNSVNETAMTQGFVNGESFTGIPLAHPAILGGKPGSSCRSDHVQEGDR